MVGQEAVAAVEFRQAIDVRKHLFDLLVAGLLLVAVLPLLSLLMLIVLIESPGHPIFMQERVGLNGRRFRMLKLRTMVSDAEQRLDELQAMNDVQFPLFKIRRDPRVTRVGRWLRATSLDELPQLINVLKREMSLVGPRPPLPREVATYSSTQARRLAVLPGLTGLWQVNGRSNLTYEEGIALDLDYVDHRTLWLDISLIVRTVIVILTGRGAY
jgi:lipopolysaccharide/colanic/teichoic acid biosynthesis glycosyltransferase